MTTTNQPTASPDPLDLAFRRWDGLTADERNDDRMRLLGTLAYLHPQALLDALAMMERQDAKAQNR